MYGNDIATVGALIAALDCYDPDTPVRFATQPGHPFAYNLGHVVCTPDDADLDGAARTEPRVVWLGIDKQVGYLPASAADALGWT